MEVSPNKDNNNYPVMQNGPPTYNDIVARNYTTADLYLKINDLCGDIDELFSLYDTLLRKTEELSLKVNTPQLPEHIVKANDFVDLQFVVKDKSEKSHKKHKKDKEKKHKKEKKHRKDSSD